jgi:hypothetical protein
MLNGGSNLSEAWSADRALSDKGSFELREEQKHDQVDCYCWLRVIGCNIGASYDACADSSAGGYVHASRGRLRRWQDTS